MKRKEAGIWLLLSLMTFVGLYVALGLQLGGDYGQYVDMHINREPVYPLYLAFFRAFCGNHYLNIAVFVQEILMSLATTYFLQNVGELFQMSWVEKVLTFGILMAPHVITPVFSQSHLVITNGIMSEALAIPVFLIFFVQLLRGIFTQERWHSILALLTALFLSLIRGQMMPTILIWAVVNVCCYAGTMLRQKKELWKNLLKRILLVAIMIGLTFAARSFMVRCYNYCIHGYFINNTYGSVNFVAQVLYVADKEDEQYITDPRAKVMFREIYERLDEEKANYRYTKGMSLVEKAYYLEEKHDSIKFDHVEHLTRIYLRTLGIDGDEYYIDQNIEIDRIAREITKAVLPHHLGKWLTNYFIISINGLVRSIAYDKSILMWYAFLMYLISIGATIYLYLQDRRSKAVRFMALALLALFANVYATSLTIMCLSRYMIYEFPVFYTALLCVGKELLEKYKKKE